MENPTFSGQGYPGLPGPASQVPKTKRELLKHMVGQAKLMEIIEASYDCGCKNCQALKVWWETNGPEIPVNPQQEQPGQPASKVP
jgi:hypothetical protein